MITYPLTEADLFILKTIHARFYQDEFSFPDFKKNCLTAFKILNDEGELITAGGIKLNPEVILLTDKDKSVTDRMHALMVVAQMCGFIAKSAGHDLISVSITNDEKYVALLKKYGFRDSLGTHLVFG